MIQKLSTEELTSIVGGPEETTAPVDMVVVHAPLPQAINVTKI